MAKLALSDVLSSYSSSVKINSNNALVEAALENTLSRDGTAPNNMLTNIDMDDNQLINLGDPILLHHAATKLYVDNAVEAITGLEDLDSFVDRSGLKDVRDYGALCDGTTDDTAAWILALADTAVTAIVVTGTSIVTTVPITRAIEIFSYNRGVVKKRGLSTGSMFTVAGNNLGHIYFHDIELDHNQAAQAVRQASGSIYCNNGVTAWGRSRVTAERIVFKNGCEWDFIFYGDLNDETFEGVTVSNCLFLGGQGGNSSPVFKPVSMLIVDAPLATITNNFADYTTTPTNGTNDFGRGFIWHLMTSAAAAHFAIVHIENNVGYRMGCKASGSPGCIDMYHYTKSARIVNNKLFEVNGAGFDTKNSSRHAIMDRNSVDGISSGSIGMLILAIPGTPDADSQFIVSNNQIKGCRSATSMAISGTATNLTQSHGIRVSGNQIWDTDATGIAFDNCHNFSFDNNEVRDASISYSVLNCTGVNKISNNRSYNADGTYSLYVDNAGVGDYLINDNQFNDNAATATIYVAAGHVKITDNQIIDGSVGIVTGICDSLVITGNNLKTMGVSNGLSITGNISGDLNVNNNDYDGSGTAYTQAGTVSGQTIVRHNSWNGNTNYFFAHKNGTDQTGVATATVTLVTFGTEVADVGAKFASNAWTPPAGPVVIGAQLKLSAGQTADTPITLYIYKDGAELCRTQAPTTAVAATESDVNIMTLDNASGANVYDLRIALTTASTGTIHGARVYTNFWGHQVV